MYYKLSNTAERVQIEQEFDSPFKYPKLYEPVSVINGLEENSVPIITMQEKNHIDYGIWGLLPKEYKGEWDVFQNTFNTLNISRQSLNENVWYSRSLKNRRCLVLVTGFFTSFIHNGEVYPYYVFSKNKKPFSIGGVYNILEDGFTTVTLIVVPPNDIIRKIQNVGLGMPLILDKKERNIWLDDTQDKDAIDKVMDTPCSYGISAHSIAKELYGKGISYDAMLESVRYSHIPRLRIG